MLNKIILSCIIAIVLLGVSTHIPIPQSKEDAHCSDCFVFTNYGFPFHFKEIKTGGFVATYQVTYNQQNAFINIIIYWALLLLILNANKILSQKK